MSLKDKRIGVLMGGNSSERVISLKSGNAVRDALVGAGFDAVALDVREESERKIMDLIHSAKADLVFIAMHGGFGEDGRLQALLEKNGIVFTGPKAQASRLAMDKFLSRRLFEAAGLKVPRSILLKTSSDFAKNAGGLTFPLVVKPFDQGSSIGISFVSNVDKMAAALKEAFLYSSAVLAEEFIAGREITVSVLDGKPLPVIEIITKQNFFDFEAKYQKGLTEYIVPADISLEWTRLAQEISVKAVEILGCRHLARVDAILSGDDIFVLEVNTVPGMTQTSLLPKAAQAAGLSFEDLCVKLLDLADRSSPERADLPIPNKGRV